MFPFVIVYRGIGLRLFLLLLFLVSLLLDEFLSVFCETVYNNRPLTHADKPLR